MVDLYNQYLKIKSEVDNEIEQVIRSSVFVKGGKVNEFEANLKQYLGVNHVITVGNGTDALQIAITALDLHQGDEVITTPFTFVSTLEVLALMKLKPVLCDIDEASFNISPELVAYSVSPRTRAIVPVHLYGQCADMECLHDISAPRGIYLIEDACQALGADYVYKNGQTAKAGPLGILPAIRFSRPKSWCHGRWWRHFYQ
jgi:dTDP-4-amino-4,6-dideoxygalactose transaminase